MMNRLIRAGPCAGREPGKPGWPRDRERDHGDVSWIVPQVTRLDESFVADEGAILESCQRLGTSVPRIARRVASRTPHRRHLRAVPGI